jgi:hypothetical protein
MVMFGPSRENPPEGGTPKPSSIRRAAGLPNAPGYLEPPKPTSGITPEVRRLILYGVGLLFCLIVTLVLAPKPSSDEAKPPPPKVEETAEERRQRVQTMFDGALAKVSDGADFDESRAYLDVLRGVSRMSVEDVRDRAGDWFEWQKAVNEPALARGKFVKVRGILNDCRPVKLFTPAGDLTDVWRCFITDADASNKTVVDMVAKPQVTGDDFKRSVVDVDAVFFRLVAFDSKAEDKSGQPLVRSEVPFLIGRSLTIYVPPPRGPQGITRIAVLGAIVLAAVVLAFMLARQRRTERQHPALLNKPGVGIREMFEMRRREASGRKTPGSDTP